MSAPAHRRHNRSTAVSVVAILACERQFLLLLGVALSIAALIGRFGAAWLQAT